MTGEQTTSGQKIFVLGDSRTGTKAIANYFRRQGLKTLHYFLTEASQLAPDHEHHDPNWRNFQTFLAETDVVAFTDFPTRSFYKELRTAYPDAYYILTTRRSSDVWLASMKGFFKAFQYDLNWSNLLAVHELVDNDIRCLYADALHFLELCIDDDMQKNSKILADFLHLDPSITLVRENATAALNTEILSYRGDFFGQPATGVVDYLKSACRDATTMPSSTGWMFQINDSSDFYDLLYGGSEWSVEAQAAARARLSNLDARAQQANSLYVGIILPDKAVVYPEYLPRLLASKPASDSRPAVSLSDTPSVSYAFQYLVDAKSYGQLFPRTSSLPTTLAQFLMYRYSVANLNKRATIKLGPQLEFSRLTPSLQVLEGDLLSGLSEAHRHELLDIWGPYLGANLAEHVTSYALSEDCRKASIIETDESRVVFSQERADLARGVLFVVEIAPLYIDLLAQHFSRLVVMRSSGADIDWSIVEAERPDLIIHYLPERLVSGFAS